MADQTCGFRGYSNNAPHTKWVDAPKRKYSNLPTTVLGFGKSHQEDLMQCMARETFSTYQFIENVEVVGTAFEIMIKSTNAIVVRDITLDITGIQGATIRRVRTGFEMINKPNFRRVEIPEMVLYQNITLPIEVYLPTEEAEKWFGEALVNIKGSYTNEIGNREDLHITGKYLIDEVDFDTKLCILDSQLRTKTWMSLGRAIQLARGGHYETARKVLHTMRKEIVSSDPYKHMLPFSREIVPILKETERIVQATRYKHYNAEAKISMLVRVLELQKDLSQYTTVVNDTSAIEQEEMQLTIDKDLRDRVEKKILQQKKNAKKKEEEKKKKEEELKKKTKERIEVAIEKISLLTEEPNWEKNEETKKTVTNLTKVIRKDSHFITKGSMKCSIHCAYCNNDIYLGRDLEGKIEMVHDCRAMSRCLILHGHGSIRDMKYHADLNDKTYSLSEEKPTEEEELENWLEILFSPFFRSLDSLDELTKCVDREIPEHVKLAFGLLTEKDKSKCFVWCKELNDYIVPTSMIVMSSRFLIELDEDYYKKD